jgi:Holliday junction resolvase RusA-like endonuclease
MAAKITVINMRKRQIDVDNLSTKALIDGLVHAGVLVDDSPEYVNEVVVKQFQSDNERVIVQVSWKEDSDGE